MNGSKPWWSSKTIWVNGLTFAIAVLGLLVGQTWITEHPQAVSGIGAAIAVLNLGLRMISGQSLTFSSDPQR